MKRVKAQEDRIADAYVNEAVDSGRYKVEMGKLADRRMHLERCARELDRLQQQEQDIRKALEHLDQFCRQVARGLDALTFEERQQLLRFVVERAAVENGRVHIEAVMPTGQGNLRNHYLEFVEGSGVGGSTSPS